MKQKKSVWLIGALALFVAAVSWKLWQLRDAQNAIPSLRSRLFEVKPSSEFLNAQKAVEYYREEIKKNPDVVHNFVQLAQLFLQEARVTGNEAEYLPRARYLLDEALGHDPQHFEALIHKASLMLTLHQFDEGKKLAEQAIRQNPFSASAYGVLVDALVELGKYDAAVEASDKMLSLRPDLHSYARASYLRELHGDVEGAIEAMKLAADAGIPGQEHRAWALYNLGNLYLQQGKLDTAAYIYKGILDERPNYPFALSGLAQVQSAKGDFVGAINLLNEAYRVVPSHHFLEQLIDLYEATGERATAESLTQQVLRAYEQDKTFGANPDLEYAAFCADHSFHLDKAWESIQREYACRPNNIQVLETYAWILAKQGRIAEAIPFIEQAMRLNSQQAELLYRAGLLYHAAGKRELARTYLQRSLRSAPSLTVLQRQEATRVLSTLEQLALTK